MRVVELDQTPRVVVPALPEQAPGQEQSGGAPEFAEASMARAHLGGAQDRLGGRQRALLDVCGTHMQEGQDDADGIATLVEEAPAFAERLARGPPAPALEQQASQRQLHLRDVAHSSAAAEVA